MAVSRGNGIILSFTWLIFLIRSSCCLKYRNELLQSQPLKDGDELVSDYGKFRLGFFSPSTSTNRYLGIWYYRPTYIGEWVQDIPPVWVANRNTPILDKSGLLTIDKTDGSLKILHNGGNPIVISSIQRAGNTSAALLESGNFVLYEVGTNGSRRELWQSFDYPTDTLLPGMKLGMNWKTGHQWILQSWVSSKSPSQGSFILDTDLNVSNKLIIRWRGQVMNWTGGLLINGRFNDSGRWGHSNYKFSYTSDEQEKYFTFSANESDTPFPMLRIGYRGYLTDHAGFFMSPCDYTYNEICWTGKIPSCRSDSYERNFQEKVGFITGDGFKFKDSDNMTIADCYAKCFGNCSCVAFATTNKNDDTGCQIWSRGTKFIESYRDGNRTDTVRIIAIEVERTVLDEEEHWRRPLTIAVGVSSLTPLFCYLCFLLWTQLCRIVQSIRNQRRLLHDVGENMTLLDTFFKGKPQANYQRMKHELQIFDFQTIAAATNNFSAANKLGEGGFGPVYKGQLIDGQEIAIKRLSRRSRQGMVEFENEAKLIAKLQHTNLVRLLGCSLQGEERILIYEYMSNKSLDFFIFAVE